MVEVGDKGIVMTAMGDKIFIPCEGVGVGDTVAVYNLIDDSQVAVPILSLDVGDYTFNTPSFDFAGFDWSLDFDFTLIPLALQIIDGWAGIGATSLCYCGGYISIASGGGKMYRTLNAGRTWEEMSAPGRTYSKMIKVGDNVLGISGLSVYSSDDNGYSWSTVHTSGSTILDIMDCGGSSKVLIVDGSRVSVSPDGGESWDLKWEKTDGYTYELIVSEDAIAGYLRGNYPKISVWNGTNYVTKIYFGTATGRTYHALYHEGNYYIAHARHTATVTQFPASFSSKTDVGSFPCSGVTCYTRPTSLFTGPSGAMFVSYYQPGSTTTSDVSIKYTTNNGGSWSDFHGDVFGNRGITAAINAGYNIIGVETVRGVWAVAE
jgi:hypothetical protein